MVSDWVGDRGVRRSYLAVDLDDDKALGAVKESAKQTRHRTHDPEEETCHTKEEEGGSGGGRSGKEGLMRDFEMWCAVPAARQNRYQKV